MNLSNSSRASTLIALATGVVIGLTAFGSASAEPAAPAPAKTVTHHLAIAASALAADAIGDTSHDYFNQWNPTALSNTGPGRCFDSGLQLPADVTLVSVTFYYTAGPSVMSMEVNRQNLTNHQFRRLVSLSSRLVTTTPKYTSSSARFPAAFAPVNYSKFAYSVGVCPHGMTTFSGLIITYTQRA